MSGYRVTCPVCKDWVSSGQEPFVGSATNEENNADYLAEAESRDAWLENWHREAEEFIAWHRENCGASF